MLMYTNQLLSNKLKLTLNSSTLMEAGVTSGSTALAAEVCKHNTNDAKCSELGWSCIPIAGERQGVIKFAWLLHPSTHKSPLLWGYMTSLALST